MEASKNFIAIRQDNGNIQVMTSKFDREVGDIMNVDGVKYKVCELFETKSDAGAFMYTFKSHLFSFFDYNSKTGKPMRDNK